MSSDVVRKLMERDDSKLSSLRHTRVTTVRTTTSTTSSPGVSATSTMTLSDRPVLVLHMGSRYTHAGFAGEDVPRWVLKTSATTEDGHDTWLVDAESGNARRRLIRAFFHKLYNKHLLVKSPEHRVLLCKDFTDQDPFFEDVAHVLQTAYSVPEVMVYFSHELALYALGTDTALFVDCGDRSTYCVAVSKTYPVVKTLTYADKGAATMRRTLRAMLEEANPDTASPLSEDDIEDIQVRACFACHPPEGVTPSDVPYDVGSAVVTVPGAVRVGAADTLFQRDGDGAAVQELVAEAIRRAPLDDRQALAQRVVLLGGASHLRGFGHRLLVELRKEFAVDQGEDTEAQGQKQPTLGNAAPREFGYLECPFPPNIVVWAGAAIASALPNFHQQAD